MTEPGQDLPPVLALLGPTAVGKSRIAQRLAAEFGCEVVSVDSAAVYRHMNIGTAKPDAASLASVPHHLLDLIDPTDAYSAARFSQDATLAIAAIHRRGRIPLLVGGTMLYYKALRDGLAPLPAADVRVREELEGEALRVGWPALHQRLARIDPGTAARLDPGDSQRIQRALEVYTISGKPLSALLATTVPARLPWRLHGLSLIPGRRAVLHEAIARRFDGMLAAGLVDELRVLRAQFALTVQHPAMRCVGYRQAWRFLEGELDAAGLRESGIAATRQLAKRQLTWLRAMPELATLDSLAEDAEARARAWAERSLAARYPMA